MTSSSRALLQGFTAASPQSWPPVLYLGFNYIQWLLLVPPMVSDTHCRGQRAQTPRHVQNHMRFCLHSVIFIPPVIKVLLIVQGILPILSRRSLQVLVAECLSTKHMGFVFHRKTVG